MIIVLTAVLDDKDGGSLCLEFALDLDEICDWSRLLLGLDGGGSLWGIDGGGSLWGIDGGDNLCDDSCC